MNQLNTKSIQRIVAAPSWYFIHTCMIMVKRCPEQLEEPPYVCVYVDDSNIFIEAKRLAEVRTALQAHGSVYVLT